MFVLRSQIQYVYLKWMELGGTVLVVIVLRTDCAKETCASRCVNNTCYVFKKTSHSWIASLNGTAEFLHLDMLSVRWIYPNLRIVLFARNIACFENHNNNHTNAYMNRWSNQIGHLFCCDSNIPIPQIRFFLFGSDKLFDLSCIAGPFKMQLLIPKLKFIWKISRSFNVWQLL